MVTTFNAITYANKLKDAGMQARVADVQAEEMSNFISSTLATKDDLKMLKYELQSFIVKALITAVTVAGMVQGVISQFFK
jgi:hypothetical protein